MDAKLPRDVSQEHPPRRRRLRDASVRRVGTVDKFQVREAAVVVYVRRLVRALASSRRARRSEAP